ncbi:50S ribosomal protein L25/general stress protein Ctc [Natronosporangium hydrolyticum]|uniref:Large ribosomal subunit protein bL25 n=1 Tax=Natronosporangium hydrolyticum TaxID=2811111 RepID=A0A895YCD1_9ACTN|nr:50S ribosomal protein L25/general stress protein Ctc [Natronosporangium hydrolyticum]QSB15447.1 50S ribosomal protein L25/general stress protein Ctc [Natronosporangium hydrolyticum]
MSVSEINAEIRTEFGKGGARRTRRAGKTPAVLYGHGEAPKHLSLPSLEFASAIRYGGMTNVLTLTFPDGTKATALPKAIQRDPLKNTYEHADLLLVRRGEKLTVEIPVHLVGEPARGTLVMQEQDTIAIIADATRLPDQLDVSIEGLDVGERVNAGDVTLPVGSELAADPEALIVMITGSPTAAEMEGETAAEAEAEAGEPGGEGESAGSAES